MRILVLTHNYPRFAGDPAGAYVARLGREAVRRGHEVRVLAPHAPGALEQESDAGVQVTRFRYAPEALERVAYGGDLHRRALRAPLVALALPGFLLRFRAAARQLVRDFRPEVIHAHWWLPAGWIAAGLAVPYVLTSHGSDVRLLDRAPLRVLGRRVYSRAGAVTAVSRFLARDIERAVPALEGRVHVASMPVDLERFADGATMTRPRPPRILYAGNLIPSKGVDVLIRAYARLRREGVSSVLRILGQGPAEPALRGLAAELGVASDIEWSPFVPQDRMPEEYGASTITVLPTRGQAEGLGLVLVEALMAGSAIVGTPAGGIPEVVEHEATGLLAGDGDEEDLARQIGRLLRDPELRARLVRTGQQRVRERYAAEAASARLIALYEAVAAPGGRRAA